MNITQKFTESFQTNLAAPACIVNGQVMNRRDFLQLVGMACQHLHRLGVKNGDVVGLSLPHAPLHLAAILALARLGAISLPLHGLMPTEHRQELLQRFDAKFVVFANPSDVLAAREQVTLIPATELVKPMFDSKGLDFLDEMPGAQTPARLNLTSGTTGLPNGICYTHQQWLERIERTGIGFDDQTRLLPGSLNLTLGNITALATLFSGGCVVFHALRQPNTFWQAIWSHNVTHAITTPADLMEITSAINVEGVAFPSLKQLRIVGGSISSQLFEETCKKITPHLFLTYGATEVGLITWGDASVASRFPGSVGKARPGVQIEAVSPEGKVLVVGEVGELRIKVPGMAQAYYNNPERSAEKFRDGWFYTGDIGKVNAVGYVWLQGRNDDKINIAGIKFFPQDVESVLFNHPMVQDVGVFAIRHNQRDELVAVVVPKESVLTAQALGEYCAQLQMGPLQPTTYLMVTQLPKNPSGKLDRAELAKQFTPTATALVQSGDAAGV
jgi:long-chain acyl-CoA synthetase